MMMVDLFFSGLHTLKKVVKVIFHTIQGAGSFIHQRISQVLKIRENGVLSEVKEFGENDGCQFDEKNEDEDTKETGDDDPEFSHAEVRYHDGHICWFFCSKGCQYQSWLLKSYLSLQST